MKLRYLLPIPLALLSICEVSIGQVRSIRGTDRTAAIKIDHYVRSEMRARQIPGMSVAIVRNGKIAVLKSYGFANVEHNVRVKPETIFQSGSIGKQFTAAAVMILVQEGRIALDDKIRKYFPNAPPTWNDITVRHLLTHTSGMGDYPPTVELRRDYTEDEYFNLFATAPLNFVPGTNWDYSNVGYVMLGFLIRKVTGKFYGDFLKERIFEPLEMTTARVISESDIVSNRAAGYRLVDGTLKNQQWVSPSTNTTADGSLYLSILDLARWDAALYTNQPLTQASWNQIWTSAQLSDGRQKAYGFGWHTETIHNRRIVFHGGAWQGFKSFIVRFPDDGLSIILLANSWETREFKLARALSSIFYPDLQLPTANTLDDTEPKVTSLVRRALMQLTTTSEADANLFAPQLRAQLFPAGAKEMGDILGALSLPVAIVNSSELVERRRQNNQRIYRYFLTDIGRTLDCTVTLTSDDKIAGLQLSEVK